VKVFLQKEGIYYYETFYLVAKMNTIRIVISLGASFNWKIHHMGVKIEWLNGDLIE
jgi:hypothetical protein